MLSQTNQMVASNATDINPDYLASLEAEVMAAADQLSVEVILLLIDKWEADIKQKIINGELTHADARNYYVRLKISLHHLKRRYERDFDENFDCDMESFKVLSDRIRQLNSKAEEARKNFYVTKRRYQGEHRDGCTCRGCRCLKGV